MVKMICRAYSSVCFDLAVVRRLPLSLIFAKYSRNCLNSGRAYPSLCIDIFPTFIEVYVSRSIIDDRSCVLNAMHMCVCYYQFYTLLGRIICDV